MIARVIALAAVVATLVADDAPAQSLAVDPNRPVHGSCGEVLAPLFSAVRAAPFDGGVARMAVEVMRRTDGERVVATARALEARHFTEAGRKTILDAFRRAYETAETEGCIGVITRRERWIVRKGETEAMWAPDDPTVVNRPVAASQVGPWRIELLDPALGFSRVYGAAPGICAEASALRDSGVAQPTAIMEPGARYRVRFRLDERGRVGAVHMPDDVAQGSPLAVALERYVRSARYYPRIAENCTPAPQWLTIIPNRPL